MSVSRNVTVPVGSDGATGAPLFGALTIESRRPPNITRSGDIRPAVIAQSRANRHRADAAFEEHTAMRIVTWKFALALGVSLGSMLSLAPEARAGGPAICFVDTILTSSEGLALPPNSGTVHSVGTADCASAGATGPGTYTSKGTFDGGCAASGEFSYRIAYPTGAGTTVIEGNGTFQGVVFTSSAADGTLQLVEIDGDCATRPIKRARLLAQFVLRG
ncbi:MAG: hypothetical protein ACT4QG_16510 [Sporichthyaceae bacterium]